MRICILTSEYLPVRGGIGTYAREIGLAAAELGAEVTLWAPDYGGLAVSGADGGIDVRRFSGGPHSFRDIPGKFAATGRATPPGYDVVHAADWPFYLPVALLPRSRSPRRIATLHGSEANRMARPVRRGVLTLANWSRRIDGFMCNSRFTRQLLLNAFPDAEDRAIVTLLGVSRFWLGETRDRATLRREAGLEPGDLAVITVGRLTPRKGHLETLAALSHLPEGLRERVVWLVVGPAIDSDYVRQVKAAAEAAPVRVRLLGEQPDETLRGLYGAADLFCLTGREVAGDVEGFGLVFLEAGAGGLAAVATRTGGVPDAVLDGATGLLFQPGSEADCTAALARCLGDDALRRELGSAARAYAEKLSWRQCAADTYGLAL